MFKTILLLLSLFCLLSVSGCSYRNRTTIVSIQEMDEKLYILGTNGMIKTYDIPGDRFENFDPGYAEKTKSLLKSAGKLMLKTTETDSDYKIHVDYHIMGNDKELRKAHSYTYRFEGLNLLSYDDKYIFFYYNKFSPKKLKGDSDFETKLSRYDMQANSVDYFHIEGRKDCAVNDMVEDDEFYWYASLCNSAAVHRDAIKGDVYIVRKDKRTNEEKFIDLGEKSTEQVSLESDNERLWVFGSGNNYLKYIAIIDKRNYSIENIRIPVAARKIIPSNNEDNRSSWFLTDKSVYGFENNSILKLIEMYREQCDKTVPVVIYKQEPIIFYNQGYDGKNDGTQNIQPSSVWNNRNVKKVATIDKEKICKDREYGALGSFIKKYSSRDKTYSDLTYNALYDSFREYDFKNVDLQMSRYLPVAASKDSVWIGMSKGELPYLLRVSKADASAEVIPVETTLGEGVKNVCMSFVSDVVLSFYFLFMEVMGGSM